MTMEWLRLFIGFVAWILASFVCHKTGKLFLNGIKQMLSPNAVILPDLCVDLVPSLGLTAIQSLMCLMMANFAWHDASVRFLIVSHLLATATTNTSMASLHTASTFTIKLSEPVIVAIACCIRSKASVPTKSKLGLTFIMTGALLFAGNPLIDTSTARGITLAFISSVFTSMRNLTIKDVHTNQNRFMNIRKLSRLSKAFMVTVGIAMGYLFLFYVRSGQKDTGALSCLMICNYGIASGLFHAVYTYISTIVVLKAVDSFSHSLAGICKRMTTVLLLYAFGQHQARGIDFIGLSVTALGLLMHVSSCKGKRLFLIGFVYIGTIVCLGLHIDVRSVSLAKSPSYTIGPRALFYDHLFLKFPRLDMTGTGKSKYDEIFLLDKQSRHHQRNIDGNVKLPSKAIHKSSNLNMKNFKAPDYRSENVRFRNISYKNNNMKPADEARGPLKLTLKPFIYSSLPMVEKKLLHSDSESQDVIFDNINTADVQQDALKSDEYTHQKMVEFLNFNLIESPFETNRLSHLLNSSRAIVKEARRVLEILLRDLIGQARYAMLMDVANIENKGDPAIALGELIMLKRLNLTLIFHCSSFTCTDRNLDYALKLANVHKNTDIVVFMQGGGNLVLYKPSDDIREKVIKRFSNFKMILLSQSIWFTPKIYTRLKRCQGLYSHQPNLTIFLRDEQSLHMAQTYFPGTSLFLAPDMAFAIGSFPRIYPPSFDIVWLRRRDRESSRYSLPSWNSSLSVYVNDWVNWVTPRGVNDLDTAVLMAHSGLTFLQRGRVVITDRLHGHILSVLLDIPHVLIDNPPAKKLSSYHHTWTAAASRVALVTDPEKALTEAVHLLERYSWTLPTKLPFINDVD